MGKLKYSDFYKKVSIPAENGKPGKDEYIYTGDFFRFDLSNKQIHRFKTLILTISLLSFIIYFFSGFIDTEGSRKFYILLPFVTAFLPQAYMVIAAFQLWFKKNDFTIFDYNRIWLRLKNTGIALICLMSVSITGELLFYFLNLNNISKLKEGGYIFCCCVIIILSYILIRIHKKAVCLRIDNCN